MDAIYFVLGWMAILSIPLWGRLWYRRTCSTCRHWDPQFGGPLSDRLEGPMFSCDDCERILHIDPHRWRPTCGEEYPSQKCGWPHCTPIRGFRDVPSQYWRSCQRLLLQFVQSQAS